MQVLYGNNCNRTLSALCVCTHYKLQKDYTVEEVLAQEVGAYGEVRLYGVVDNSILPVEARNEVMHREVVDGHLEVGLFCIHHHPHTLAGGTLAQQIKT